jgi:hypothetical protein
MGGFLVFFAVKGKVQGSWREWDEGNAAIGGGGSEPRLDLGGDVDHVEIQDVSRAEGS